MSKKDPKIKKPLYNESGEIIVPFLPHSITKNNPVTCSLDVNEDPRIITKLARANEIHEQYQADMTSSIKNISGLEILIRKEKLKKEFLQRA